jgi:TIR domain/Bacterial SH3 domain
MPHDVFISHSSKDKVYADAVCARLESDGIRCWIAPRDILPGMSWGSAIVEAIESTRLMVLLFSSNANASPQIEREVERALNKEVPIVPLRLEPVIPGKNLEYFLGTPHWLDAVTPPFEQHLEYIAQTVKVLLQHSETGEIVDTPHPPKPPAPMPAPPKPRGTDRRWLGAGTAVAAVAVLIVLGWWLLESGVVPRKLVGVWTTTNFVGPDKIQFTMQLGKTGTYRYEVLYKESGRVRMTGGQMYLRSADGLERPAGPPAPNSVPPVPANLLTAIPSGVWPIIDRFSMSSKQLPAGNPFSMVQPGNAAAPGKKAQPAIWEWDAAFGKMAWQIKFRFDYDGGFTFSAQAVDVGRFVAHEGRWKAVSEVLEAQREGAYSFVGNNSVVLTGSVRGTVAATERGNTLWERMGTVQSAPQVAAVSPSAAASPAGGAAGSPGSSAAVTPTTASTPAGAPTARPPLPPVMALDRRFIVSHDSSVYAAPDSSGTVVGHVRRGRYVHITGLTGNWLRVQLNGGTVGFIPDQAVE